MAARIASTPKLNVFTIALENLVSSRRNRIRKVYLSSQKYFRLYTADTLPPYWHSTLRSHDGTKPTQPSKQTMHQQPVQQPPQQPSQYDHPLYHRKLISTAPPLPYEQRSSELTFEETGHEKTFMFASNNTFIQMDGDIIQTFQLRLCREISFQFRTRLAHGLLVYHNVKNPDSINLDPYALYVIVEKGQLKVVHVFGKHSTSVTVGEGLNRDEWHR